jgi:hypothetical protein
MPTRFTCPQGHRWEVTLPDQSPGNPEWILCPACGARPAGEGRPVYRDDEAPRPDPDRGGSMIVVVLLVLLLVALPVGLITLVFFVRMNLQRAEAARAEMEAAVLAERQAAERARYVAAVAQAEAVMRQQEEQLRAENDVYVGRIALAQRQLASSSSSPQPASAADSSGPSAARRR